MNHQKHFARFKLYARVVLAAVALGMFCVAIPAFGQDAAAPSETPAKAQTKTRVTPIHHEATGAPENAPRLSAQDPVAPRSSIDTLAEIKKRGTLRVGVSMIVPWAMHDKDGKLIGFEIDVAKKIARDMGVEVEFYPDELRYLIPDLKDNRFDIIVSGFSISTNRALQVNFSQPYNTVEVTFVANKEREAKLKTLGDFNAPDVLIGVLDTSTAVDIASNAFPNAQLKTYPESADIFSDLLDGKIVGAVADSPRPEIIAKLFPDKVDLPSTKVLATFPAAFAVRRGDMDFVNFLNSWIEARTVNKWLENRRNYWFRTTDWEKRL
jgi:polar amino acid transport system substrate-binding protein